MDRHRRGQGGTGNGSEDLHLQRQRLVADRQLPLRQALRRDVIVQADPLKESLLLTAGLKWKTAELQEIGNFLARYVNDLLLIVANGENSRPPSDRIFMPAAVNPAPGYRQPVNTKRSQVR